MSWISNVHNRQRPTWSGQVRSALVLDLSATDTSWHFSPTEKIKLPTINNQYHSTENLLTTHYNTETGKILHSNEKLKYMKMLDVITLFSVHFYSLPPIFSTEKKKIPSEMEVAPRYNCWHCRHCWHCWHCWHSWHCSTLFDTVDMTNNE